MSKTYLTFSVLKIAFPLLQLLQPAGLKGTDGSRRWGSVGSRSASSVPLLFDSLGFLRRDVNESQKKKWGEEGISDYLECTTTQVSRYEQFTTEIVSINH